MPTARNSNIPERFDHRIIESWIRPGSRVLDLGCGTGTLLERLNRSRNVTGVGIEKSEEKVVSAISRGLSVIQGDINQEIDEYPDGSFDYVVLSQTLQQVYDPSRLIQSMLRAGRQCIVSFPNFNHWRIRMQIILTGRVPVTPELPYQWYDTPNIRVLSLKDFKTYAKDIPFRIFQEKAISRIEAGGQIVTFMPNIFATYGIFLIGKEHQ